MIHIEAIEINYFRSIYSLKLKDIRDVCVLAGKNDTGESNILKALNLFFNNQVDWHVQLDFARDFSKRRLEEVRKETIKGKQFIRVKLSFIRGNESLKSLPERFEVTKTWHRDSLTPSVKSTIERQFLKGQTKASSLPRALAGFQRYLNRVRFEYVPAIKDHDFFRYCLGLLQDTILKKRSGETDVKEYVKNLNESVAKSASMLSQEFKLVCGIKTDIRLPEDLAELFRAFFVATGTEQGETPLAMRGDGIQSRFLASLMHYIANNSRLKYIWGFEEPENCLEHGLATKLAQTIVKEYSQRSQIIVTSHSPAFIALKKDNVAIFRIHHSDKGTISFPVWPEQPANSTIETALLTEDLGLSELLANHQKEFEEMQEKIKLAHEINQKITKPTLLTEGESDVLILKEAWKHLRPGQHKAFKIESCNTTPHQNQSSAGVGILTKALQSQRPVSPITIGMYDRDEEGIKEYGKLGNNFIQHQQCDAKCHKNGHAAAFLIPIHPDRAEYANAHNLNLEFFFDDIYLMQQIDGHGLNLIPKTVHHILDGGFPLFSRPSEEPQYRDIGGEKIYFAQNIVPTFPPEAFVRFNLIFELVERLLGDMQSQ